MASLSDLRHLSLARRSAKFEYAFFDSPDAAAEMRAQMDRDDVWCTDMGSQTVDVLEHERYFVHGVAVELADRLLAQRVSTLDLPPEAELPTFRKRFQTTRVEVHNTTLTAATRKARHGVFRVLTIMPTDGNHPGGKLLDHGRGTEEFMCRTTTVLSSLAGLTMYPFHREFSPVVATDWAALCPGVSVIRSDDGELLRDPWTMDILAISPPRTQGLSELAREVLLTQRFTRMLWIAGAFGYDRVVLPPFGTGAYGAHPELVADCLARVMVRPFRGTFDRVVLANPDWSPERRYTRPFHRRFRQLTTVA